MTTTTITAATTATASFVVAAAVVTTTTSRPKTPRKAHATTFDEVLFDSDQLPGRENGLAAPLLVRR